MKSILYLLLLAPTSTLGSITIDVSDVKPLPLDTSGAVATADELFRQSCPEEVATTNPYTAELILSSYSEEGDSAFNGSVYPSSDSFVRGAIVAWAQHQSLVLRPETVWFEILAQMNFYMKTHAEEIRDLFVDFEGQKEIVVLDTSWQSVIAAFGGRIQELVKTDWLLDWITPGFSTSTANDNMTATVLMMGLMQHYFEYTGGIICGLPSVTLLGTRDDWVKLSKKLDHLDVAWGPEPAQYASNLRPILNRFVQTWDEPQNPELKSFWSNIVRANRQFTCGGPAQYSISGWITGFMHWTPEGRLRDPSNGAYATEDAVKLDGVSYTRVGLDDVPVGYAKAPLKMLDYPEPGVNTGAYVLAGNIGIQRTVSTQEKQGAKEVLAQPMNAWFLFGPVDKNFTTGPMYGNAGELRGILGDLTAWCPAAMKY